MLWEAIQTVMTRSLPAARKLGYVHEAIGLYARYRRVRRSWQPHLQSCHAFIAQTVAATTPRDAVLVLGSGWGLDIPLTTLEHTYRHVYLVDIVHPRAIRRRSRHRDTLTLIEGDLSGLVTALAQAPHRLSLLLQAPRFPHLPPADLILSCNLLSQLPLLPLRYAAQHGGLDVAQVARTILLAHARWLASLHTPVCLLSDYAMLTYDRQGMCVAQDDLLAGLSLPAGEAEWDWEIAPWREVHKDFRVVHRVRALRLRPGKMCVRV